MDLRLNYEHSSDSRVLALIFMEQEVGDVVTYEELSKAIRQDVRTDARPALDRARYLALKEGYVFENSRGVGYVRLDSKQTVKSTERDRRRISRISKTSLEKLSHVDFEELDRDAKQQFLVTSAQMGAISSFASKGTRDKLMSRVNETSKINLGDAITFFKAM